MMNSNIRGNTAAIDLFHYLTGKFQIDKDGNTTFHFLVLMIIFM